METCKHEKSQGCESRADQKFLYKAAWDKWGPSQFVKLMEECCELAMVASKLFFNQKDFKPDLLIKLADEIADVEIMCEQMKALYPPMENHVQRIKAEKLNRLAKMLEEDGQPSPVVVRTRAIIAEQLGVKPEEVTPGAYFMDDLGADSLDIVELTMSLEEEFNIQITDEDAQKMKTVGDAVEFIKSKRG